MSQDCDGAIAPAENQSDLHFETISSSNGLGTPP